MAALAFLTPLGGAREPGRTTFDWFPLVGALIGAAVGLVWWGADEVWSPLVAATVAVAADVALTGALHVDGLADTADGVLPHLDRERRLAVMAEPDVGAFGVTAVVLTLGLRVAVLASLEPDIGLLAALWCASRTVMAVAARSVPYARGEGGLAAAFLGRSPLPVALGGAVLAGGLAVMVADAGPGPGPGPGASLPAAAVVAVVAVVAVAVAGAAVVALARRRLGGFTGDVLGAAGLVGETVGLLVAAARW
ncbi:MAG TPA: adenosylcobinamide-GDP ribazoletransferase [Acidimicrobiales bacterium]|nr:adenosylcobinamide-GDP ribazoletransferase [Acidimicrobiales bacterium]